MPSVDTARAILSTLDALGVTHVLYCPGSRSAPFAYALESGAFGGHARAVLNERADRDHGDVPRIRVLNLGSERG